MLAILALGGNLGNPREQITEATYALNRTQGIRVTARSPLVESFAVTEAGIDENAPRYLNGVVEVETSLEPEELLQKTRELEQAAGRTRETRWGPRTLDIDIIAYDRIDLKTDDLTIPHPRAHERAFVLVPWSLMQPDAELPGRGRVADLAKPLAEEVWLA
jgi:2-amino-4-hydroxy-6-hydroxymethyldihydropteridine diphosphokinase